MKFTPASAAPENGSPANTAASIPDLICLGKALTGGFPLSACVGRADLMDAAWPASNGEAIHTSTFLGHPVGCAMALAQIAEIRRLKLCRTQRRTWQISARANCNPEIRKPQISNLRARSRLDGRRGIATCPTANPRPKLHCAPSKHVASRLHFPAGRRTRQRHQLHAAADHHQGATGESRGRTGEGFGHG